LDAMTCERERVFLPEENQIMKIAKELDLGKIVPWGEVSIKLKNGSPVMISIKKDLKIE